MKNKLTTFILGAALGAVIGLLVHYLFGPGNDDGQSGDAQDEQPYRSRLQAALDAGREAASEKESEIMASFEKAKRLQ